MNTQIQGELAYSQLANLLKALSIDDSHVIENFSVGNWQRILWRKNSICLEVESSADDSIRVSILLPKQMVKFLHLKLKELGLR